jgi:hypothetical protein
VSDRRSGRGVDFDSSLLHVLVVDVMLHVGVVALFTSRLRMFSKIVLFTKGRRGVEGVCIYVGAIVFEATGKAEGDAEWFDAELWRRWMNGVVG